MTNPRSVVIPTKSGVYQIKNRLNGKFYVGSATKLNKRRCAHICTLNKGNHHSAHLQRSWNKYGASNFEFIILELVDVDRLIEREQFYIDTLQPNKGRKLSPEHKEKLLAASRGRTVSQETREKIRQSLLGRPSPKSDEFKERVRQTLLGVKHSPERVEKMRQSKLKRYREDPDLIQRLSDSHKGKSPSIEQRRKQSDAMKAYWRMHEHPRPMLGKKGTLHHAFGKKWSAEIVQKRAEGIKRAWAKKRLLSGSR